MKISPLFLVAGLVAGCASSSPDYDAVFGDAVRQSRASMTLNPNAGSNPDPVVGMDGKAARETVIRYQESFQKPPPVTNVINIGGPLGGGGSGGSGN